MFSLRKFKGKRLVAYLRQGDYSHPGESESIELVMQFIHKKKNNKILDLGCGLGGTAYYLSQHHYGQIYGLDIETESIEYAQKKYKNVTFKCGNVVEVHKIFKGIKFDVFVLFNSFYAFSDQATALKSLHQCAKTHSKLLIFDYSINDCNKTYQWITPSSFIPVVMPKIASILKATQWRLIKKKDITAKYCRWYDDLCRKLEKNKTYIVKEFGEAAFTEALRLYSKILNDLSKKNLGGCIIYAKYEH